MTTQSCIGLSSGYCLHIKNGSPQFQVVLTSGDIPVACHFVSKKDLYVFLYQPQGHLFNGRMQLKKDGDEISIFLRKKLVGKFPVSKLTVLPAFVETYSPMPSIIQQ